jgi:phage terminase large subunit-like protein
VTARDIATAYADAVLGGSEPAGKWIYAAAKRFRADLERPDLIMDWDAVEALRAHFGRLTLVGEASGKAFDLHPWQTWALANIVGWRWRADGRRRVKLAMLQIARGNGKTTLMAGLAVWDLLQGDGRRVHVLANTEEQAGICLDTAKTMAVRLADPTLKTRFDHLVRPEHDCEMTALPAKERSLDGLNPSLWIADECAEYRGRFLTKLLTTGSKRTESLGVLITTPGSNPENHYSELVKQGEAVLTGELEDDALVPMLYGLDPSDPLEDEGAWVKANPGLPFGQPDLASLRRSWNTMRRSPAGRGEFSRYHAARADENTGGWLDMALWPGGRVLERESLRGRPAWAGLDLSKSFDMSALVLAIPLEDGRVVLEGHYWWPREEVAQRELDYRMPIRQWSAEGKVHLTPGREVDYGAIRARILELRDFYDIRLVGYDRWGAKTLAEDLIAEGVPLQPYAMGIATFGPGCQLFANLWQGQKLVVGDDPVLRRSCAEAHAKADINGNVRPVKSREHCILDPLVGAIMAVHVWGGKRASCYEES